MRRAQLKSAVRPPPRVESQESGIRDLIVHGGVLLGIVLLGLGAMWLALLEQRESEGVRLQAVADLHGDQVERWLVRHGDAARLLQQNPGPAAAGHPWHARRCARAERAA